MMKTTTLNSDRPPLARFLLCTPAMRRLGWNFPAAYFVYTSVMDTSINIKERQGGGWNFPAADFVYSGSMTNEALKIGGLFVGRISNKARNFSKHLSLVGAKKVFRLDLKKTKP